MDLGNLTAKDKKNIGDYLLIKSTELKKADLCLVFGNAYICDDLAAEAARLYKKGLVRRIVACGGVDAGGAKESERIAQALIDLGVPMDAIIVESASKNTQENIEYARSLLDKYGLKDDVRSVIGVGHITASRRFLMTMARRWPEVLAMQVGVNPYPVPVDSWDKHPDFCARTLRELQKIPQYMANDWLREIDVDRINDVVVQVREQEEALLRARHIPRPPGLG